VGRFLVFRRTVRGSFNLINSSVVVRSTVYSFLDAVVDECAPAGGDEDADPDVDAEGDEDEEMLDYSAMQTEQSLNRKNKQGAENANVMGEPVAPGKRASTPEYNRMPEPRPPTPLNASGRPQRKAAQAAVPKIAKRKKQQREDLESEDEDEYIGVVRRLDDSDDSGEDERDEDVEEEEPLESAPRQGQPSGLRGRKPIYKQNRIKSKSDLPIYAQHAYSASAMGFPKLPMPMIFLPGLKSRKPPPIPVPELTKKSRGRRVPDGNSSHGGKDDRKYKCHVADCGKSAFYFSLPSFCYSYITSRQFARGEHLKRHIRSIHTNEKPHQCPYPGCPRSFSRTDNMMQHMRTHDDWPTDEAAASMIVQMHQNLTTQAVQKPEDVQKHSAQFPFFPIPAMVEGSSKAGAAGMPHGVPMMIPWMGMSGMTGVHGMPAAPAGSGFAAPPTPTTPVSASSLASIPSTITTRSRSDSTTAGSTTPTHSPASVYEENEGLPAPLQWAIQGRATEPEAQPIRVVDEDEDENEGDPIDDNDRDEDYTGRAKKRKKPVRGAAARSRAQRKAAIMVSQASGDKNASNSRVVPPGMLPFPTTGMFGPGMFPPSPGGMQLPPGMPFNPPGGMQLPPGMPLQLPHGMPFPPLMQLPTGMQFPPVSIQPGQIIHVMVPDGKGGMQVVPMPMMPPGWTPDGVVDGEDAGESAAGNGTGHNDQSGVNGGDLSIGAASNAEVAEGAVAVPLENVTHE